jgi:hypothetical protein
MMLWTDYLMAWISSWVRKRLVSTDSGVYCLFTIKLVTTIVQMGYHSNRHHSYYTQVWLIEAAGSKKYKNKDLDV